MATIMFNNGDLISVTEKKETVAEKIQENKYDAFVLLVVVRPTRGRLKGLEHSVTYVRVNEIREIYD